MSPRVKDTSVKGGSLSGFAVYACALLDMLVLDVSPFARFRAKRPVFIFNSARFGLSPSVP